LLCGSLLLVELEELGLAVLWEESFVAELPGCEELLLFVEEPLL